MRKFLLFAVFSCIPFLQMVSVAASLLPDALQKETAGKNAAAARNDTPAAPELPLNVLNYFVH